MSLEVSGFAMVFMIKSRRIKNRTDGWVLGGDLCVSYPRDASVNSIVWGEKSLRTFRLAKSNAASQALIYEFVDALMCINKFRERARSCDEFAHS